MNLDDFSALVRTRRATRVFKPETVPQELLLRLLEISDWAPSGYNLQPTHYLLVTETKIKERLLGACMHQKQIMQAPAIAIFCGDRDVVEHNLDAMIAQEKAYGAMNESYEAVMRKFVGLAFDRGPLGLNWLWKALLPPLGRLARPIPSIPAVYKEYWLSKQVMLNAMVFMLAAHAAGLATVPMEGFDEGRVRRAAGIPASFHVPLVVPVGYADNAGLKKTRLPIAGKIHCNGW